jgi:hypothetical protein
MEGSVKRARLRLLASVLATALAGCHELFSFSHTAPTTDGGAPGDAADGDLDGDARRPPPLPDGAPPLPDLCPTFVSPQCNEAYVYPPVGAQPLVVARLGIEPPAPLANVAVGDDFHVAFALGSGIVVSQLPNRGCPVHPWSVKQYGAAGAQDPVLVHHPGRNKLALAWTESRCPNNVFLVEYSAAAATGPYQLDADRYENTGHGPPGLLPLGNDYLYFGHVRYDCVDHVKPIVARISDTTVSPYGLPWDYNAVDPWVSTWHPAVARRGNALFMLRLFGPDGSPPDDGAMSVYLDSTTTVALDAWSAGVMLADKATTDRPQLVVAGQTLWGAWGKSAAEVSVAALTATGPLKTFASPGRSGVLLAAPWQPAGYTETVVLAVRTPTDAGDEITLRAFGLKAGVLEETSTVALIHRAPRAVAIGPIAAAAGGGGIGVAWQEGDRIYFRFAGCR